MAHGVFDGKIEAYVANDRLRSRYACPQSDIAGNSMVVSRDVKN